MKINNPSMIPNKIKCNRILAKYLENKGVPLLSFKDGEYYFADTIMVKNLIENAPFLIKVGKIIPSSIVKKL